MASIFPIINPSAAEREDTTLPVAKEVLWDEANDCPLIRDGAPVIVTGQEAVMVWVRNCLRFHRKSSIAESWDYGVDWDTIIGAPVSRDTKESILLTEVKRALLQSDYINGVECSASFSGKSVTVTGTITTIYGTEGFTYEQTGT